jgi:hypothetical protein
VVVLHAFLALAAGFATIVLLTVAATAAMKRLTPDWVGETGHPGAGYVFVNLGTSFLAAAAGGYATALTANANPLVHVLALGIAVLALAALSVLQARGKQPIRFQLAMVAVSPFGVLAGGLIRMRVLGIL